MNGDEQIEGRVFFPPGDTTGVGITVKLRSMSSSEITGMAAPDGSFRFTHLRTDTYTIIVDAGDAYEKATEIVSVGFAGSVPAQGNLPSYVIPLVYPVQIYLKLKHPNSAAAADPAFDNLPPAARDLFQQALENARGGNNAKAIEQLKLAISQAPRFARAYNELAAEYLKIGRGDQALETLKTALETDPDDLTLRLNYGIALLNQKKIYEAQSAFESAIKNGGDKLALVHKYLGGIYWRNKHYREAADELEKYLKLEPKAVDAEKIRSTIKELRHKT